MLKTDGLEIGCRFFFGLVLSMTVDMSSDLHTPLTRKPGSRAWVAKIKAFVPLFNRVGGALLAFIALGLGLWVFLIDDRLGGEPQMAARVQIASSEQDTAPSQEENVGSEQVLGQGELEPGQPRVLQVPQQPAQDLASDQPLPPVPGEVRRSGPRFDAQGGLPSIADPNLVQRFDSDSFVPQVGPSGERALDAYARPVEAGTIPPGQPRIAIIVGGLGLSQTSTQEVINRLPSAMTLSFAPYGNSLSRWTTRARQSGHEYLIEIPMEPFDYPNNDPGPHTLLTSIEAAANLERMHWALSRVSTPVGLMNYMGGRFASEDGAIAPVMSDAVQRGLMVIDDGRSARSRITSVVGDDDPVLRADVVVDGRLEESAITSRLTQLENLARERGHALGVASALPLTISQLEDWASSLNAKGIVLVPVSSLVRF